MVPKLVRYREGLLVGVVTFGEIQRDGDETSLKPECERTRRGVARDHADAADRFAGNGVAHDAAAETDVTHDVPAEEDDGPGQPHDCPRRCKRKGGVSHGGGRLDDQHRHRLSRARDRRDDAAH